MTDPKQPLYDILRTAFEAGIAYDHFPDSPTAGDTLFPLAARMETEIHKLINTENEACATICSVLASQRADFCEASQAAQLRFACDKIRARSLPSSPERET